jgi:hypothetical protein
MLDSFYKRIETEYEVEDHSWDLFSDLGDLSENDRALVRYEYFALNNFEADSFKEEIETLKKPLIDYFTDRKQQAKSPHLLARYNHFLLHITRNNSYAPKTIEYYQQVLAYYLSIHSLDYQTLHFSDTLECIISLSVKDKLYRLIKPYPNYYSGWATDCHGLSRQDTADAPLFPEVCAEIAIKIL